MQQNSIMMREKCLHEQIIHDVLTAAYCSDQLHVCGRKARDDMA